MESCMGERKFSHTHAPEKKANGEIYATGRPSRESARVRLSDITNKQRPLTFSKSTTLSSEMDAIQNLHKENMMLRKLIDERNKTVELTALEVQKLRVNLQKVYTQNWQLAKANSQILAELNSGKDRLKEQQHEHGCAMALLRAKNSELEEKLKNQSHHTLPEAKPFNCDEVPAMSLTAGICGKTSTLNRRRQSRNTTSNVKSSGDQQVLEKLDNKRRRRSSAFKAESTEHTENLFELENANFSDLHKPDEAMHDDFPALQDLSNTCISTSDRELKIVEEDRNLVPQSENVEQQKSVVGRAMSRQVQSACPSAKKLMNVERRRSGRRSSAIKLETGTHNSLKVEDAAMPTLAKPIDLPAALNTFTDIKGDMEENGGQIWSEPQPLQGRKSLRRAVVGKVISYKEKPINIKERR
ncbi:SHUGOSHIN 2-like isoform X2 [Aristolochia californica]|uniref:SHUGOSHIN 2-like isoform X2 n=1 Tax=Aristolochia californica TaxID=171875 RepID=UPI0035DDF983